MAELTAENDAPTSVTEGMGSGSTRYEGEEQHSNEAERLPGLQAGQCHGSDRQPRHRDAGLPVVRLREHHGDLTHATSPTSPEVTP